MAKPKPVISNKPSKALGKGSNTPPRIEDGALPKFDASRPFKAPNGNPHHHKDEPTGAEEHLKSGRKPSTTKLEAKKFFGKIFRDPGYRRSAIRRIFDGTAPHLETLGWYYYAGKPIEKVKVEGSESFAALLKLAVTEGGSKSEEIGDKPPANGNGNGNGNGAQGNGNGNGRIH